MYTGNSWYFDWIFHRLIHFNSSYFSVGIGFFFHSWEIVSCNLALHLHLSCSQLAFNGWKVENDGQKRPKIRKKIQKNFEKKKIGKISFQKIEILKESQKFEQFQGNFKFQIILLSLLKIIIIIIKTLNYSEQFQCRSRAIADYLSSSWFVTRDSLTR